jgi:hypothetical protein
MLAISCRRSMKPDILDSGFIDHLVNHGIPCLVTPPKLELVPFEVQSHVVWTNSDPSITFGQSRSVGNRSVEEDEVILSFKLSAPQNPDTLQRWNLKILGQRQMD